MRSHGVRARNKDGVNTATSVMVYNAKNDRRGFEGEIVVRANVPHKASRHYNTSRAVLPRAA